MVPSIGLLRISAGNVKPECGRSNVVCHPPHRIPLLIKKIAIVPELLLHVIQWNTYDGRLSFLCLLQLDQQAWNNWKRDGALSYPSGFPKWTYKRRSLILLAALRRFSERLAWLDQAENFKMQKRWWAEMPLAVAFHAP